MELKPVKDCSVQRMELKPVKDCSEQRMELKPVEDCSVQRIEISEFLPASISSITTPVYTVSPTACTILRDFSLRLIITKLS